MTAAEKTKIAQFLDLSRDFITSGYRSEQKEYRFNDEINDSTHEHEVTSKAAALPPLEQIAQEIKNCKECQLCNSRKNAAPGEGAWQPLVMVIGEGPGEEVDKQGRPFVGKAGQLLDKMLGSIDLSRTKNCFIANVIKCRPPNNRDPYPEETAACANFLQRQISFLKPKFILVAGRVAAQTLLKTSESIGKLRGNITEYNVGDMTIPLLVTYHPAALLRNEDLKRPAWEDLKLLRSKLETQGI
jgi:DNA polymerase